MRNAWMTTAKALRMGSKAVLLAAAFAVSGFTAEAAAAEPGPGQVGAMAHEFTGLKDFAGKAYNLHDYRGKVVLIMTVQYNCGGCRANAPRIGKIAKSFQGKSFQAFGPDINFATATELGSFDKVLRGTDTALNFPLLSGLAKPEIKDSVNNGSVLGTMYVPYNALRDVYFVIDHTGKIVFRMDGNRGNAVDESKYTALTNAISGAIASIPTVSIAAKMQGQGLCLQACKKNGNYVFDLGTGSSGLAGNIVLKIMDPQGRIVRELDWDRQSSAVGNRQALWDGYDSKGNAAAWGNYFVNASAAGQSVTMLLAWLP